MGLPVSPVDICNLAADHCGEAPISSISPPVTSTEKIFARHYDATRLETLRLGVWNFAKTSTTISRVGSGLLDYPDIFQLPTDFVRFLSIGNNDYEYNQDKDYDIQKGGTLFYDASGATTLTIRYIADVPDVTMWDDLFRRIMSLKLALAVGYAITKKADVVQRVSSLLAKEMPDAQAIDGQEHPPIRIQRSKYLAARRGGISYGDQRYTRFDD